MTGSEYVVAAAQDPPVTGWDDAGRLLQPAANLRVHVGVTQKIEVPQSVPDPLTTCWDLQRTSGIAVLS